VDPTGVSNVLLHFANLVVLLVHFGQRIRKGRNACRRVLNTLPALFGLQKPAKPK
jgi:hypothetical protein